MEKWKRNEEVQGVTQYHSNDNMLMATGTLLLILQKPVHRTKYKNHSAQEAFEDIRRFNCDQIFYQSTISLKKINKNHSILNISFMQKSQL